MANRITLLTSTHGRKTRWMQLTYGQKTKVGIESASSGLQKCRGGPSENLQSSWNDLRITYAISFLYVMPLLGAHASFALPCFHDLPLMISSKPVFVFMCCCSVCVVCWLFCFCNIASHRFLRVLFDWSGASFKYIAMFYMYTTCV